MMRTSLGLLFKQLSLAGDGDGPWRSAVDLLSSPDPAFRGCGLRAVLHSLPQLQATLSDRALRAALGAALCEVATSDEDERNRFLAAHVLALCVRVLEPDVPWLPAAAFAASLALLHAVFPMREPVRS